MPHVFQSVDFCIYKWALCIYTMIRNIFGHFPQEQSRAQIEGGRIVPVFTSQMLIDARRVLGKLLNERRAELLTDAK